MVETTPGKNQTRTLLSPEHIRPITPLHLAGMFEVGGGIRFRKQWVGKGHHRHQVVFPLMIISDKNREEVKKFQQILGGRIEPVPEQRSANPEQRSVTWSIEWTNAARLALSIKPFAPLRRKVINAISKWVEAKNNPDIRLSIAESLTGVRKRKTRNPVTLNDYINLVKRKEFVAGVFDSRATISTLDANGHINLSITIMSQNKPLLDALQAYYNFGKVHLIKKREKKIRGTTLTPLTNSWEWRLHEEDSYRLLEDIGKYLILRLPEFKNPELFYKYRK